MTEFSKEDIEYYRKQYALWTSRGTTPEELHLIGRLREALDEIERLQARVENMQKTINETEEQLNSNAELYRINHETMQQRIAELEQATMWTPVSKPVEGNNLEILCYSNEAPHYESYFAIYIDGIFGEYESGKFLEVFPKPTHYMYKPKPPKYKPPQPPKEGE